MSPLGATTHKIKKGNDQQQQQFVKCLFGGILRSLYEY